MNNYKSTNSLDNFKRFEQLSEDDCWVACSKMIIDFMTGIDIDYSPTLLEKASSLAPNIQGTADGICALLNHNGINSEAELLPTIDKAKRTTTHNRIIQSINQNVPVAVGIEGHAVVIIGHAVVIIGYDEEQKKYLVVDPYTDYPCPYLISYNTHFSDIVFIV